VNEGTRREPRGKRKKQEDRHQKRTGDHRASGVGSNAKWCEEQSTGNLAGSSNDMQGKEKKTNKNIREIGFYQRAVKTKNVGKTGEDLHMGNRENTTSSFKKSCENPFD